MKKYIVLLFLVLPLCKNESPYKIGQQFQGGIIFYIDKSGEHGLIAAPTDQADSIEWGCESVRWDLYDPVLVGASGTAIGTGMQNTIAIINNCDSVLIAARICKNLSLNGYSDWYLPSKNELNLLYANKDIIGGFPTFLPLPYWSSSEYNKYAAWRQDFANGEQTAYDKYNYYHIRAIRSF
jgi:hypothetical protein